MIFVNKLKFCLNLALKVFGRLVGPNQDSVPGPREGRTATADTIPKIWALGYDKFHLIADNLCL